MSAYEDMIAFAQKSAEDSQARMTKEYMILDFFNRMKGYNRGKSINRIQIPTDYKAIAPSMLMRDKCNDYTSIRMKSDRKMKCRVCWDTMRYQAFVFTQMGIPFDTWYVDAKRHIEDPNTSNLAEYDSFSVFVFQTLVINDRYYYFESTWQGHQGVYSFSSINGLLTFVKNEVKTYFKISDCNFYKFDIFDVLSNIDSGSLTCDKYLTYFKTASKYTFTTRNETPTIHEWEPVVAIPHDQTDFEEYQPISIKGIKERWGIPDSE